MFEATRSISLAVAAGADLPQRRLVAMGATGIALAGAGADAVGVSLEGYVDADFAAGNASNTIPVALLDGAKIEVDAGAAVAVGAALESDATGRVVTAGGVSDRIIGYALTAAGAADEVITIVGSKAGGFAAQV